MTARIKAAVALLESEGFVVVPFADLPVIRVDEQELLATIDGFSHHEWLGHIQGRSVSLENPGPWFPNHSVEGEYRRAVAHLAMARWYSDNGEHERKVYDLAVELAKANCMDGLSGVTKKQHRKFVKAARAQIRATEATS